MIETVHKMQRFSHHIKKKKIPEVEDWEAFNLRPSAGQKA
jgi:hypothetical protein